MYPFRIPGDSMVCVYCCESYDDPSDYRTHQLVEHNDFHVDTAFAHVFNNYTEYLKVDCFDLSCRLCYERFDSPGTVANHLATTHSMNINLNVEVGMQMFKLGPERWLCALCNIKLPCLRALSRHTSCHYHKFTCETCGKSYVNRENLTRHIKFGHSESKICIRCKKSFPSCAARREHVLATRACWPLSCGLCGERFANRRSKLDHLVEVHAQPPKTYTCPECGKSFDKWRMYRSHFVVTHTTNNYTCAFCDQKFDNNRSLLDHRIIHTKEKAFPCAVCSKSFSRKKNLMQHMWIHKEQKRFECTTCNKQFNQRVSWKTHMKSYHPEQVDF